MPTYDLSHPIRTDTPVYPGDPPVECRSLATVPADGYRTTQLTLTTHTGTHVDAPAHMRANGRTIDSYPPETFRFAATVLDLTSFDPRTPIDATLLEAATGGSPISNVDLVVLRTGWDRHWGASRYVDHPYLTVDAAETIVAWECHLGVDTPNVDPTPKGDEDPDEPAGYPAHHVLFDADRLIVENLRGLDRLPTAESIEVHAYPLSVDDADGAPVRAVAVV